MLEAFDLEVVAFDTHFPAERWMVSPAGALSEIDFTERWNAIRDERMISLDAPPNDPVVCHAAFDDGTTTGEIIALTDGTYYASFDIPVAVAAGLSLVILKVPAAAPGEDQWILWRQTSLAPDEWRGTYVPNHSGWTDTLLELEGTIPRYIRPESVAALEEEGRPFVVHEDYFAWTETPPRERGPLLLGDNQLAEAALAALDAEAVRYVAVAAVCAD